MKRFVIGFAIMMCSCTRLLPPEAACGFQQWEGRRTTWHVLPVKLWIDRSVPAYAIPALNAAIYEYNTRGLGGREMFRIVGTGFSGATGVLDGYNVVDWRSSWDSTMPDEEAKTHVTFLGEEIFDADVLINTFNFNFIVGSPNYSYVDLQSLFTHELGHALGLAHIDTEGSVMNPILDPRDVRRSLGAIDLSDLQCGYPN